MPGWRAPQCPRHSGSSAPPHPSPPPAAQPALGQRPCSCTGPTAWTRLPGVCTLTLPPAGCTAESQQRRTAPGSRRQASLPRKGSSQHSASRTWFQPEVTAQIQVHSPPGQAALHREACSHPCFWSGQTLHRGVTKTSIAPKLQTQALLGCRPPGSPEGGRLQGPAWTSGNSRCPGLPFNNQGQVLSLHCTWKGTRRSLGSDSLGIFHFIMEGPS